MRYLTLTFPRTPASETDNALIPGLDVDRGTLCNMNYLHDGTLVQLCRLEASRDSVVADLESWADAISYDVFDTENGDLYVFVHSHPRPELAELLRIVERHRLLVELPIELEAESVTVRIAGASAALHDAMDDLPADATADVRIEQLGAYDPEIDAARSALTDRQRTVLDAAVDVGYYATPRTATIEDVAAAAECAESTASEHLRKIEARLLPRLS
ncbi:helix-turn-helix domain-containing protein [Haloarcula amylovorans]|uniref:helix-turn-helix domain-containing protein n=1 Tax=Haloarcula amylovorans TaxID=2562280 RepID=UPI0014305241|nr:helix-turn-helix domain-containing protein [Halomicroarcula amylolytica]